MDSALGIANTAADQRCAAELRRDTILRHLGYRPLVYLTAALVLGVVAAERLHIVFCVALLLPLTVTTAGFLIVRRRPYSQLWLIGAFFCAGMSLHAAHFVVPPHDVSHFVPRQQAVLVGRVVEIPDCREYWRRLVRAPESVTTQG